MRNANDFEHFDLRVTTPDLEGADTYLDVRSFSKDGAGSLHIHDDNGPLAIYSAGNWLAAIVVTD